MRRRWCGASVVSVILVMRWIGRSVNDLRSFSLFTVPSRLATVVYDHERINNAVVVWSVRAQLTLTTTVLTYRAGLSTQRIGDTSVLTMYEIRDGIAGQTFYTGGSLILDLSPGMVFYLDCRSSPIGAMLLVPNGLSVAVL